MMRERMIRRIGGAPMIVRRVIALGVGFLMVSARFSGAQSQLTAGDGKSAILPVGQAAIVLDLNEAKVGVHLHQDRNYPAPPPVPMCGHQVNVVPDHRELTTDLAVAAKKGKRSLLSSGSFVPGFDLSFTAARFFEHGFAPPAKCPSGDNGFDVVSNGYDALFLSLVSEIADRKTVEVSSSGANKLTTMQEVAGPSLGLKGGWNHAFGSARILGLDLEGVHDWKTVGDDDPSSVCTQSAAGVDKNGNVVTVQQCEDRFIGPLPDAWHGRARVDWTQKLWRAPKGGPAIGFLAAASLTTRSTKAPTYGFVLGPTLHPKDKPSNILGAMLFEVTDLTNSTHKHPTVLKMLNVRLVLGLPLD